MQKEIALTASAQSQQTSTQSTIPVWSIDPVHSNVEFTVKHMVVSTVRGRFGAVEGQIHLDPEHPEQGSVVATIDATSIDTNNEQRDEHLRSADFFDVENHPTLTFKSTGVEVVESDHWKVHGDLTIRGTTRPVTLDVTLDGIIVDAYGNNRAAFTATTSINRKEFGLNWNALIESGGAVVSDKVNIELHIAAVQQS